MPFLTASPLARFVDDASWRLRIGVSDIEKVEQFAWRIVEYEFWDGSC